MHNQSPRVITVDKNPTYPVIIAELIYDGILSCRTQYRQVKYLNKTVEQDHRFIRRIISTMLGFKSFKSAENTLARIEAMHMIRKRQINFNSLFALNEVKIINVLLGLVA